MVATKIRPRPLSAAQIPAAVRRMTQPKGVDRFEAAKAISMTAEKFPQRVYP